jgi:hypothetical protein
MTDAPTDGGRDRLSFLGRPLGPAFEMRVIDVAPGCSRAYDEAEWRDAIVVVERGEIELECSGGSRHRFGRGDILWLAELPLRVLHNRGRQPAVLVAVSRRRRRPSAKSAGRRRLLIRTRSPSPGIRADG